MEKTNEKEEQIMLWNKNLRYSVLGMSKMQNFWVWSIELRAVAKPSGYCGFWKRNIFLFSMSFQLSFNFYSLKNPMQFLLEFKYRKDLTSFQLGKGFIFFSTLYFPIPPSHIWEQKDILQNRRIERERHLIAYSPNPHFSMKRLTAWEAKETFKRQSEWLLLGLC